MLDNSILTMSLALETVHDLYLSINPARNSEYFSLCGLSGSGFRIILAFSSKVAAYLAEERGGGLFRKFEGVLRDFELCSDETDPFTNKFIPEDSSWVKPNLLLPCPISFSRETMLRGKWNEVNVK